MAADFDLVGSLQVSVDYYGRPGRTVQPAQLTSTVIRESQALPCHACARRSGCRTECGQFKEYAEGAQWHNRKRWQAKQGRRPCQKSDNAKA